ncbi:MAG: ASPIC/UnbV domain-containing protein, partial [Burkholderiales bacterium]|nr:ASPIC/UnbV domain-containing protein [Burkholderiales bacterium]
REVKGSEGFGATNQYRQHFGLGPVAKVDSVEIVWPSGTKQQFSGLTANQVIAVREDNSEWRRVK